MVVADEASRCAMEAATRSRKKGTKVMLTAIPDPSKTGGVEAMKTGKGNPPRNAGTVARKAITRVSVGRSAPIRRKPDPDPVKPTKEIGNDRTTPKDPKKSERGHPS